MGTKKKMIYPFLDEKLKEGWSLLISTEEDIIASLERDKGTVVIGHKKAQSVVEVLCELSGDPFSDAYERFASHYLLLSETRAYVLNWIEDLGFLCRIVEHAPYDSSNGHWGSGDTIIDAIEHAIAATMHYTP